MRRAALLACCALLAALAIVPSPAAAISHGTKTFDYTGAPEIFTVPEGVEWLHFDAVGGHGGQEDHTARGGRGAGVTGAVKVKPGTELRIYVGQVGKGDGGWGWAHGGSHGTVPGSNPAGNSGAGGGGASAVLAPAGPLVVAGGGGGGGGDENNGFYGGPGGDGGNPAEEGSAAKESANNANQGSGGCGGCEKHPDGGSDPDGGSGENADVGEGGGAGGGGGGGSQGGHGAKNGSSSAQFFTGIGGGGGGGGSSAVGTGTINAAYYASSRSCPTRQETDGPQCNGVVTLEWGAPPAAATVNGGSEQHTAIGARFANPLSVKVTDEFGVPVPDVTVTFSAPDNGASGFFRDPSTSLVRELSVPTNSEGIAGVAEVVADSLPGKWTAEASVDGAAIPARFALTNDAVSTSTVVSSSTDPSLFGQPTVFTASVLPEKVLADPEAQPTGAVQFFVDGAPYGEPVRLDVARGTASAPARADLTVGTHQVRAQYLGDAGHLPSAATTTQRVEPAATALTLTQTPSPSEVGEGIVLGADVAVQAPGAGVPSGSVQFAVDGTDRGAPVPLSAGHAELPIPGGLALGTHTITATYAGAAGFAPASAQGRQSVGPTATATLVSSSVNPAAVGEPLTLTAAVRREDPGIAVSGEIAFSIDGTPVCEPQAVGGGQESVDCRPGGELAPGPHEVEATFTSADHTTADDSSGALTQVVSPARTRTVVSVDPEPSAFGGNVLLSASVATFAPGAGEPEGTVQFFIDGNALGLPVRLVGGSASISPLCTIGEPICSLTIGGHAIEAEYVDDSAQPRFARSHGTDHHLVTTADTTTELSSSADPESEGTPVTFTAAVSATVAAGKPSGSVQFLVDGDAIGDAVGVRGGRAISGPVRLGPGDHRVEARYLGASTFSESATAMTQRVTAAADDGGGEGAAPGGGAAAGGDAGAASGRIALGGKTARVDDEGTFLLPVACEDGPCTASVSVRAGKKVLARRLLSLRAGEHASLPVDLDRAGELRVSRGASTPVVVRVAGEAGTKGGAMKMKLVPTRAPLIRVLTRTAFLDRSGAIRLRMSCAAPRSARCRGILTLRDANGRTLATEPVSLRGAVASTVSLTPAGSWSRAPLALPVGGAPEPISIKGTVTAVSEIAVGRDARSVGRIEVNAR
jgi:hypothetical protein